MVKNLNFNFWVLLLVLVVFFSSSSIAYADEYGGTPGGDNDYGGTLDNPLLEYDEDLLVSETTKLLNICKLVQQKKGIDTNATNFLMFHYRGCYYLLISYNTFSSAPYFYDFTNYACIVNNGGWFLYSKSDKLTSNADAWEVIKFSNDNYNMAKYEENLITVQNVGSFGETLIANTGIDAEDLKYYFCTQDINGFCFQGVNPDYLEGVKTTIDIDYPSYFETIINKLTDLPSAIVDGVVNGIKGLFVPSNNYFSNKLKSIENKYVSILGFSVNDFEAMLKSFANETPIKDVYYTLNVGSFSKEVKVLDASIISQGIDHFRPYIRGFVVLLMVFFSMNQLMYLFKINSISGSGNDTDKK